MKDYSKEIARTGEYLKTTNNAEAWNLLDDGQKAYCVHLVEAHGWEIDMAIQRAYIFGYDPHPYDYRLDKLVEESEPRENFGL